MLRKLGGFDGNHNDVLLLTSSRIGDHGASSSGKGDLGRLFNETSHGLVRRVRRGVIIGSSGTVEDINGRSPATFAGRIANFEVLLLPLTVTFIYTKPQLPIAGDITLFSKLPH